MLKIKDIAEDLGISENVLRMKLRTGEIDLPHKRIGLGKKAHYRFDEKKFDEWKKRNDQRFVDPRV